MTPKPFYSHAGITIYCGDSRELLPQLEVNDAIITDPIWPNTSIKLQGADRPYELFQEFCDIIPRSCKRLIVQIGCDSDPRFLKVVPGWMPYLRTCTMEYTVPSYKGNVLNTGDFAFVFGQAPQWRKDRQLMPGLCRSNYVEKLFQKHTGKSQDRRKPSKDIVIDALPHPATRRLQHLYWLVHFFSDTQVIDPFMGSGTTLIAAKFLNRQAIGIEIEEKYCELAVSRLAQEVMDMGGVRGRKDNDGMEFEKHNK